MTLCKPGLLLVISCNTCNCNFLHFADISTTLKLYYLCLRKKKRYSLHIHQIVVSLVLN